MATNFPTRRGLLGAIAVVPAAMIVAPISASATLPLTRGPADGGLWWRTFERHQRAAAASLKYHQEVVDPVYTKFLAGNDGCHWRDTPERKALSESLGLDPLEDHGERLDEIAFRLHDRLIKLPAPDAQAALWKFNYMIGADEGGHPCTPCWTKSYMEQTFADVRRFIGGEAS